MLKLKQKQHPTSQYLPIPRVFLVVSIVALFIISPVLAQPRFPGQPTSPQPSPSTNYEAANVHSNPVITTSTCGQGLSIAFVVDASRTMEGSLGYVRADLHDFTDQIAGPNGILSDRIKMSITYFGGGNNGDPPVGRPVGTSLTTSTANIKAAIERYRETNVGTYSAKGLEAGYNTLRNEPFSVPKLLIIMTDGKFVDEDMQIPVDMANMIKQQKVRIMAIGVEHPGKASNFTPGSQWYIYLKNITNGRDSRTDGAYPDFIIANAKNSLGTELKKIAQGICAGPGNGNGGNGNGIGGDGVGIGNHGIGIGKSGAGQGVSPQSPAPSPNPAPAPSARISPNPQPNPAPTPTAQGVATTPPPQPPSPFFDGKEYSPGSNPATFAKATLTSRNIVVWIGGGLGVSVLTGLGGWLWARSRKSSGAARMNKRSS